MSSALEEARLEAEDMSQADLQALAKRLAPFSVDHAGYIWIKSDKGGRTVFAQLRGWGYLTGQGSGALSLPEDVAIIEQTRWGVLIARALNDFANGCDPSQADDVKGTT